MLAPSTTMLHQSVQAFPKDHLLQLVWPIVAIMVVVIKITTTAIRGRTNLISMLRHLVSSLGLRDKEAIIKALTSNGKLMISVQ